MPQPTLSIVIGAYNMERELPRTLHTLSRDYQRGCADLSYEIIVVDNGSTRPVLPEMWRGLNCDVRLLRFDGLGPSPVRALNQGLKQAKGRLIGLMIDGARMLSPGVFHHALLAERLAERRVICTHGFHLGPDLQPRAILNGYNQQAEDKLLESIDWRRDGYRLLEVSVFAGSAFRGWLVNPNESNCLILPAGTWAELNYLDERFLTPGGGLVNLDLFKRACELPKAQLITLLGEGTFHQIHGGIATASTVANPNEPFDREYERLHGDIYRIPTYPSLLIGELHPSAMKHLRTSIELREKYQVRL